MALDLTHIDEENNPTMVDISDKGITARQATAIGLVVFPSDVFEQLVKNGFSSKKGPINHTAIIAGTMAVKKTSELIPFCHPIPISSIKINIENTISSTLTISCTVKTIGKTGVEMEALQGVTAACLTIYDMCKALSHDIVITDIELQKKTGGKRDFER